MSLSLFAVTKGIVVQVSDRLLTLVGSNARHDPNSNKGLVYEGDGVRMLVSYTGLAYIGSKPTDHFLAEVFAGHAIEDTVISELGGRRRQLGNLSMTAKRLVDALNRAKEVGHFAACSTIDVALVGWRWSRNLRLQPFAWGVSDSGLKGRFKICSVLLPRYWRWDRQIRFIACPNPGPIMDELTSVGKCTINELAEKMVNLIRKVSTTVPTVGSDCLVTTLVAATGEVRHRFVSQQLEAQFTPWVITRSGILHPSEVTSAGAQLVYLIGGLNVSIDAPLPTKSGMTKPQKRTGAPQSVSRKINSGPKRS